MSKGLVLLVDDYEEHRKATAEFLGRHGFDVEEFGNASKLLERFESLSASSNPPAAIVSDNDIKGSISGTQLAKAIRLIDKNIPFLLVSNLDVGGEITKPLNISFLSKDKLYDFSKPKDQRNIMGLKLDEMIQFAANLSSGELKL